MIRLERVSLWVAGRAILTELSFDVPRSETLAIVGESGGGKTSLARLLLGLLPGRPLTQWEMTRRDMTRREIGDPPDGPVAEFRWAGAAWVGGLDVLRATPSRMRAFRGREAGLIVQGLSDALNPQLTVLQHMREALAIHRPAGLDPRAACLAHNIPADLHDRLPAGLSGGEVQRVLTALALVGRPPCLILDEPTAALDPVNRERAIAAFTAGREARSQLLITHDLDLAARLADRIGVLHQGRLVEIGPAREILERPRHPYARILVGASAIPGRRPAAGMAPDSRSGLRVSDLSHRLDGRTVLRGVSMFVPAGECLTILGASGCGKSTLARLLTGFESIRSGTVGWHGDDRPTAGLPCALPCAHPCAHPCALVPQHPHRAMARHFSVAEVLREALRLTGRRPSKQRPNGRPRTGRSGNDGEEIAMLLAQVGLPADAGFLDRRTWALSGGEAQRLAIARALATRPRCLVADEPTSALDPCARTRILDLLDELRTANRIALVLFTHDRSTACRFGGRIAELRDGRLCGDDRMAG